MENSQKKLKLIQEDKCDNCGAPLICYSNFYRCEYCGSRYQLIDDNGNIYPIIIEAIEEIKPQVQLPQNGIDKLIPKEKITTFFLCLIFGWFGVHRFYTKNYALGLIYLFTCGFYGIGVLIDLVMILTNEYKDGNGQPLK